MEKTTIYEVNGKTFDNKKDMKKYVNAYKIVEGVEIVEVKTTTTIHKIVEKTITI